MLVKELVKLFMEHNARLVATGERSPATVKFYNSRFKWLLLFFVNRKWKTIKPIEILEFLEYAGNGRSGTTRRHNVTAINTLQRFARKQGLAKKRIFKALEKPPMGRRTFTPTDEQTDALLSNASVAFRIIHAALAKSAARPGEMCQLNMEDIDWYQGLIVLTHHKTARKTGQPRLIPVGSSLAAILRTAIGTRTAGPVFLTECGSRWQPSHLSSMFRRLRIEAGLPREYVLYSERHGTATKIVDKHGIEKARVILGHSSITMTQRYTHLKVEELGSIMDSI